MSIASEISALQADKTAIANAITSMGGTVASGDGFDSFANKIKTLTAKGSFTPVSNQQQLTITGLAFKPRCISIFSRTSSGSSTLSANQVGIYNLTVMFYSFDTDETHEYDTTQTYNIGNIVKRNGNIYRCKVNGATGSWKSSKWIRLYELEGVGIYLPETAAFTIINFMCSCKNNDMIYNASNGTFSCNLTTASKPVYFLEGTEYEWFATGEIDNEIL